jgi:hypothetical protein
VKAEKVHRWHLICVAVLFLFVFGVSMASGQPGCGSVFSAGEACAWPIQSSEYVFLGKVVSVYGDEGELYGREKKFVVEVESLLRGNLRRRIDLTVTDHCMGMVRVGGRHIFTANSVANEKTSGLVSDHWSTEIGNDYSKGELDALLSEIRAVVKKVRQPRLVGAVVEKGSYPDGRWMRRASGASGKLAIDSTLAGGHVNAVVTARRKDGLEFRTATGVGGYFVFNELPNGIYELSTDLPDGYNILTEGTFHTYEGDKKYLLIDDSVCSKKVWFSVQLQGGVKVRIRGVRKEWSYIIVHLYRVVGNNGGKRELFDSLYDRPEDVSASPDAPERELEQVFKEVPVGEYVIQLNITTDPNLPPTILYYPGTSDVDRAVPITVEPAKSANLEITIP